VKQRGFFSIAVAALIVGILLIFLIAFQVRFDEVAVVYQFEKPVETITKPGLYFKYPYPIQTVRKYSKRVRTFETKYSEYFTKDRHTILVAVSIGWKIEDPITFQRAVGGDRRKAEEDIEGLSAGARQEIINSHELGDFINTDPGEFQFKTIEDEIEAKVREEALKGKYGVSIAFLDITKFNLPEDVTKDVLDRIRAERTASAKALTSQGENEAAKLRASAERQASAIRSDGEAKAIAIRGEGDAEAAKHYKVFDENPLLANFLKSLDALEQLKRRTTYILTTENPPYRLLDPSLVIPGREPKPERPAPKPAGSE
jgi:membrane protease subunit HflC